MSHPTVLFNFHVGVFPKSLHFSDLRGRARRNKMLHHGFGLPGVLHPTERHGGSPGNGHVRKKDGREDEKAQTSNTCHVG